VYVAVGRNHELSTASVTPQPLCTCTCRLCGPTISTVGSTLQIDRLGNVKGQSVLCFKGPLTIENVSLFQSAIRREESFSTVILDLSDVPYIDSTALGALVSAYVSRQKLGRRVVLSGASDRVSKMLKIQRRIAFPYVPDARRCNRRSHAGWYSLVKKRRCCAPATEPFSAAISESRINVPSDGCSSA
jgi:anti-anti-sigma factor